MFSSTEKLALLLLLATAATTPTEAVRAASPPSRQGGDGAVENSPGAATGSPGVLAEHHADEKAMKTTLDMDGFCPEYEFGGGKDGFVTSGGKIGRLNDDLVMVKIFWAEHLPSGGGAVFEDVPDLYIKYTMDGVEAQTRVVKDSWTPLFGQGCYFKYGGNADLTMDLYEYDFVGSDDHFGHLGFSEEEALPTRSEECNNSEEGVAGECSYDYYVFKEGHQVIGKDGEPTTVKVALKFVDALPKTNFGVDGALVEAGRTEAEAAEKEKAVAAASLAETTARKTGFDEDGYCPQFSFGGNPPKNVPGNLFMVKVWSAQNLPNGGGFFTKDIPDLYIKFSVDGAKAQTNLVKDSFDPVYQFSCFFPYLGAADLKMDLWERDSSNADDFFGHVGFDDENGIALGADFLSECVTGEQQGECARNFFVFKDGEKVVGDNGEDTLVTLMVKDVNMKAKSSLKAPLNLGE